MSFVFVFLISFIYFLFVQCRGTATNPTAYIKIDLSIELP